MVCPGRDHLSDGALLPCAWTTPQLVEHYRDDRPLHRFGGEGIRCGFLYRIYGRFPGRKFAGAGHGEGAVRVGCVGAQVRVERRLPGGAAGAFQP